MNDYDAGQKEINETRINEHVMAITQLASEKEECCGRCWFAYSYKNGKIRCSMYLDMELSIIDSCPDGDSSFLNLVEGLELDKEYEEECRRNSETDTQRCNM